MGNADVIKEFLIGLGFKVDYNETKKFNSFIGKATLAAAGLGIAAASMAAGVVASVRTISEKMEDLYYASRRIHTTVTNLEALRYAASQIGLTAGEVSGALENFAQSLRINPGLEGLLNSMGIVTRINGKMRDNNEVFQEFIEKLRTMPHFIATQYAAMFGISERTLLMLEQGMDEAKKKAEEYKARAQEFGVDLDAMAEKSRNFMNHLRDLMRDIELLGMKVFEAIQPVADKFIDTMQEMIKAATEGKGPIVDAWNSLSSVANSMLSILTAIIDLLNGRWQKAFEHAGEAVRSNARIFNSANEQASPEAKEEAKSVQDYMRAHRNKTPSTFLGRTYEKLFGKLPEPGEQPAEGTGPAGTAGRAKDWIMRKMPLGMRLNNPGNLRAWGDQPREAGFAKFDTTQQGLSAMAGNLMAYAKKGIDTIRGIVNRWAPASDNNDVAAYEAALVKRTGHSATEHLDLNDPATLRSLMAAMIQQEQGSNPFSDAQLNSAIASRLGGGVQISQNTQINVTGGDADATARRVADEQSRVNGDLVRNAAGAIR